MKAPTTILVIDDHPTLLENLELALTAAGHEVLTVRDADEALAVLQSESVDLIVIDITGGAQNGSQLYQQVRENRQWPTIPFIFLTTWELDSELGWAEETGPPAYLRKPFEPEALLAAVQDNLRRAEQPQS